MWPWLAVLIVSIAALAAVGWEIWPWVSGVALTAPKPAGPVVPAPAVPGRVRVRIFLPQEPRQALVEEDREVAGWLSLREGVQRLLEQLANARAGGRPPLPPGIALRHVYLDAAGILYLDFDQGIQRVAGGDWVRADLASSAIGLTMTANLGEVKRVQFLADGAEIVLLSGGIDLRRPFTPRFPGEEPAAEPAAAPR